MKRLISTEIPNTISSETKKPLKNVAVLNPADCVFASGPDSWLRDGREDNAVNAQLVGSIIMAYDTDNRSDEAPDSDYEGRARQEGTSARKLTKIQGNPVIWGALSSVQITIMGTDDKPVLVIAASGRQTAKASEWLTEFLKRCRKRLSEALANLEKRKDEAALNYDSLVKRLPKAKESDKAGLQERAAELAKQLKAFEGKDLLELATKEAKGAMQAELDPVAQELNEGHFSLIFDHAKKLGRPLVGPTYSAQVWMKVDYSSDLPTERRSLEKSKLANFQVPSLPSTEAEALRRLVRSYCLDDGLQEHKALERAKQFVRPLMAVGADVAPSVQYVEALYRFSMICKKAQQTVDAEKDPRKMLTLFYKYAKHLYTQGTETVRLKDEYEVLLSRNDMSEEEQLSRLNAPKQVRQSKPKAAAAASMPTAVLTRLTTSAADESALSYQAKREARAVLAWERHRGGDAEALKEFPHLLAALSEDAAAEDEDTPLSLALCAADCWNGKGLPTVEFAVPEPKDDADDEWKAYRAKEKAFKKKVADAKKLIDAALEKIPAGTKPAERSHMLRQALEAAK